MQPALSPLDGSYSGTLGGPTAAVPPPSTFRPWTLPFYQVKSVENPYTGAPRADSEAKRIGLRYEQIAQRALKQFPEYVPSPAFMVTDAAGSRLIIPDGVFELQGVSVVVEIKIRHMPEAYWQLEHLYAPPLRWLSGPRHHVFTLEIVKSFDPAMPCPAPPQIHTSLSDFFAKPLDGFNVFVWAP